MNQGNHTHSKPMFWSFALEDAQLKLRRLSLDKIGDFRTPVPESDISNLVRRAASGEFKNYQNGVENNVINIDASFVSVVGYDEDGKTFNGLVLNLGATALKNATHIDFDFLNLNLKVNFKKALICLPGASYKSYTKPAVVESGFAGTILIQLPIQNGLEGTSLNVVHLNEQIARLDLTKNSSIYSHLTLLLNLASDSPLHFEITPPTSGAVIMMVFHLVWLDSFKLTTKLSTLPAFLNFTSHLKSSITRAEANNSNGEDDSNNYPAQTVGWNHPLYYLPLPQLATLDSLDSSSSKGEASDVVFALSSVKHFEVLGVAVETVSRDSNGNANSVIIRKIVSVGNTRLTPTEWIGNTFRVVQVSAGETDDVVVESTEEFGALAIPRRELLLRSCLNDLHRVIETIHCRFSSLDKSTASELLSTRSQLIYDLQVVTDFVAGNAYNFENPFAIADLRALLDMNFHMKLNDCCAAVLESTVAQVLPKLNQSGNVASLTTFEKDLVELIHQYSNRIGKRDIAKPIKHLVSSMTRGSGDIDLNQLILDTLSSRSLSMNVAMKSITANEIHSIIDSLSSIDVIPSACKSSTILSKIGDFFLRFDTEQLIKVLLGYQKRHPKVNESFPDVYCELFRRVTGLSFESCSKKYHLLEELVQFYAKCDDVNAFARVFTRSSYGKPSDTRFQVFNDYLMSRIENWSTMQTLYSAIKQTPGGTALLQRLFSKLIDILKNTSRHSAKKKQQKAGSTSLPQDDLNKAIRFTALGLFWRDGLFTSPAIPHCIQDILNLLSDNQRGQVFSGLMKWDEEGLKNNDEVLSLVTETFHAHLVRSTRSALSMCQSEVWSQIGDCFAWKADMPLIEKFMKDLIAPFRESSKQNQPKGQSINIFKGILRSSVGFGPKDFNLQKPMLKEKFIDEILDLWITQVERLMKESGAPSAKLRTGIISCIAAFFRARKLNLFMPKSLAHVQLLHKMAKTFNLDNLTCIFGEVLKIEVDPVRPVSKAVDSISWRLYVSMCSWAISSEELEGFLKTCDVKQAELLYGFALWCGNKHMLENLNEKILSLTGPESGCALRESLANLPSLKRLAVDACSKEALNILSDIKSVSDGNTDERIFEEKLHEQPDASAETADTHTVELPVKKIKTEPEIFEEKLPQQPDLNAETADSHNYVLPVKNIKTEPEIFEEKLPEQPDASAETADSHNDELLVKKIKTEPVICEEKLPEQPDASAEKADTPNDEPPIKTIKTEPGSLEEKLRERPKVSAGTHYDEPPVKRIKTEPEF